MDPNTSIGRLCLGENDHVSLNDGIESKGNLDTSEYCEIADSGWKNETNAFTFYRMETEEVSKRYITLCFVVGLNAYDGEINMEYANNMISNEFVVKLCLEYEGKNDEKVMKRELPIALRGELYFVKFIINSEEDDVEPGVIFGRSFLRFTKGIVNFGNRILAIYPDLITFNDYSDDELDAILASINELLREELENDMYERMLILSEKRPIIKTLKYSDQHKKLLDSVLLDKLKLDGEVEVKEEVATKELIRSYKAIKEKNDHGVFVIPIRLEGKFDFHALVDTKSNINWGTTNRTAKSRYNTNLARLLPKQIYSPCIVDWNVINTLGCVEEIEAMLKIKVYEMGGQEEIFTFEAWRRAFDINKPIYTELCHEFYSTYEFDEVVMDKELITKKFIKFRLGGRGHSLTLLEFTCRLGLYNSHEIREEGFKVHHNGYANVAWLIAKWLKRKGVGSQRESMICCGQFIMRIAKKMSLLTDEVLNGLSAPTYYRSLDATTLRELIGSNGRLIAEDPAPSFLRLAMPRPPCPTMQDLYKRMGSMKIR
ncbi:hypothetical protein Tco_0431616 [Tanacetum coccineum]